MVSPAAARREGWAAPGPSRQMLLRAWPMLLGTLCLWLATGALVPAQPPNGPAQPPNGPVQPTDASAPPAEAAGRQPADGRSADPPADRSGGSTPHGLGPMHVRSTIPYRRIFFFQDEAARLVPANYRAVAAEELESLLLRPATVSPPGAGQPRLEAAEYWASFAGGTLRSTHSEWAIRYQDDAPGELNLGRINLALGGESAESPQREDAPLQPPFLHTAADGSLRAAVAEDCTLPFQWTAQATSQSEAKSRFVLEIPPCGQAPFFLDLPRDHRLEQTNGIPIELTGPPPEASNEAMESARRWYKIEAGGLSQLNLEIVGSAQLQEELVVPLRQQSTAFRIAAAGMRWTTQMTIERLEGRTMPPLYVGPTRITSVRIDGQPVRWEETVAAGGREGTTIQLTPPRVLDERLRSVTTNIAISGTASVRTDELMELPYPDWLDCDVARMMPNVQTQLTVDRDLTLAQLALPAEWDVEQVETSPDGDVSYQLWGPAERREPLQVELFRNVPTLAAEAALQLDVAASQIKARWDARVTRGASGPRPLQFRVEPQWRIDSIMLPASERVIEVPAEIGPDRLLTIWPEADEWEDEVLPIRILGHRLSSSLPLVGQRGVPQIPDTWFVRPFDCRVKTIAAINPPAGWRWPGESIIRSQTLTPADLPEATRAMLGRLSPQTLLFALSEDSTATLKLERPLPVVEADVTLALTREGSHVQETLTVNLRTPGDAFSEVHVRTGPAHGRPPLNWSLAGSSRQTGPLATLQAGTRPRQEDELWVIRPPPNRSGELHLIGRRRYRLQESQRIDLPTVAQAVTQQSATGIAANQDTSALIGRQLHVADASGPVQRVPAASEDAVGWHRLRYDPSEPAAITLTPSDPQPAPLVVWEERIQVHASSRWGDTIVAEYETEGHRPLRIEYDPAMSLEEAATSGRPFVLSEIMTDRGAIVIPAASEKQRLRLQFRRPAADGGLLRWWTPPSIRPQAVVLRSAWSLYPVADTVIPDLARGWIGGEADQALGLSGPAALPGVSVDASAAAVCLIANEGFWALGTIVGLCLFALAWWSGRTHLTALLLPLAWTGCLIVWWPHAALALTGFLLLPLLGGGLLGRVLSSSGSAAGDLVRSEGVDSMSARRRVGSTRLTGTSALGILCALSLPIGAGGRDAVAQEGDTAATAEGPLAVGDAGGAASQGNPAPAAGYPVLIPVDDQGQPAGSTLYVPDTMYERLFLRAPLEPQAIGVQFQRAEYRVRLGTELLAEDASTARLDVRLTVVADVAGRALQLPFPAAQVRSAEILLDDGARSVRWLPQGEGITIVLPRVGINALRLALVQNATNVEDNLYTLQLPIPAVMDCSLSVDAENPLQAMEVTPCHGHVDFDARAGSLSADLGAVTTLGLRWRRRREADLESAAPLIRRWLVHAGAEQIVSECEMDLSALVAAAGDEVELELGRDQLTRLTSRGWRLVSQTAIDPMRQQVTVAATEYPPPPLRLMWETAVASLPTVGEEDPPAIRFEPPNVMPLRPLPVGPGFIALDVDPRYRVEVDTPEPAEIEKDRFLKGWTPGVDLIDRAYIVQEDPPALTFRRPAAVPWRADERQHLHLSVDSANTEGQLTLAYQANVIPGDQAVGPMRLRLPLGMRVQELRKDGEAVTSTPRETAAGLLLTLPDEAPREGFRLELQAWMPLPAERRFQPPRVLLEPLEETTGAYLVTRGSQVVIDQLEPTGLPAAEIPVPNAKRLSDGIIPRWSWRLDSPPRPARPHLAGLFEVQANPTETRAAQITDLFWQDGRWSMETTFDIRPVQGRIDFLAFELPTRWSEELEVSPAISWSIQPAAEANKRLLRILPENPSSNRLQIRIRSRLRSSDSGQVSVPDVRLLGEGTRRRFIGIPPRLTNDPIRWETNGARRAGRPQLLQGDTEIDDHQLIYEVGGNWFAKLVSVMATRRRATATVMDLQLFPQPDRSTLAICRWDLLPADRADIEIRIPEGAEPLGSWSAGLPAATTLQADRLNVPLNLSRLGQSVELLIRLPVAPPGVSRTLPQLVDIPVKATWLACHEEGLAPPPLANAEGWQRRAPHRRALALGESVAEVLEGSLDSLAQRPNDEIAAWLLPWLDRADRVLTGMRSTPSEAEDATAEVREAKRSAAGKSAAIEPAVQRLGEANIVERIVERIAELDRRLEGFTSSVLGTRDVSAYQRIPGRYWFTLAAEDQRLDWVAEYPGQATSLPAAASVPSPVLDDWPLERFAAGLGVLLGGLLIWRFSRRLPRLVGAPACWLFLIGLAGLLVAPLPVAITVCLIGLAAPWLGWARRRRAR